MPVQNNKNKRNCDAQLQEFLTSSANNDYNAMSCVRGRLLTLRYSRITSSKQAMIFGTQIKQQTEFY